MKIKSNTNVRIVHSIYETDHATRVSKNAVIKCSPEIRSYILNQNVGLSTWGYLSLRFMIGLCHTCNINYVTVFEEMTLVFLEAESSREQNGDSVGFG